MNRALSYGLMGAASGIATGLYNQWQQNQEDIRTEKLARAKAQEEQALQQLKYQFESQANYQKVMAEFATKQQLQQEDNQAKAELESKKQEFESKQKALDRASEEKRSGMSAGATIQAAKIRSEAETNPKPRGEQIWQTPDGRNIVVKPGETPPEKGNLIWTQGGSVGARVRGGTPGIGSALNGALGAPAMPASDEGAGAPPAAAAPGSSQDNPIDATSTPTQPPPGTWVRLPSGRVMQIPGA